MRFRLLNSVCVVILCVGGVILSAKAQNGRASKATNQGEPDAHQKLKGFLYTTVAYKKEALRLLIKEANDVARQLNLSEDLPITPTNLIYVVIGTPKMVVLSGGGIGTIGTSNYEYSVGIGDKLCFITSQKLDSEKARKDLKAKYLWPIERRNTNAAYQLATQWLAAIQMDVQGIERDSQVHIWSWTPDGVDDKHFVPLYWVVWKKADGPVASVELLEPTHLMGQVNVDHSEYILRRPVVVTNLDSLLSQTNDSKAGVNSTQ